MTEARIRPVQVRIVPTTDAISCEVRIPRVNIEAVMADPEGVAAQAASIWALHIREYLNLPPASGSPLVVPPTGTNPLSKSGSGGTELA